MRVARLGGLAVTLIVNLAVAGPRLIVLNEVESGVASSMGYSFLDDSSGVSAAWADSSGDMVTLGVWSLDRGLLPIHSYDPSSLWGFVIKDVSRDGRVLAGDVYKTSSSLGEAAYCTAEEGIVALGVLGSHPTIPGAARSVAFAVEGKTVIGMSTSLGGDSGFRWTQEEGMVGLDDMRDPSIKIGLSVAMGIRHDESIVGYAISKDDRITLVRWSPDGTVEDLVTESDYPTLQAFRASAGGTAMVGIVLGDDDPAISAFVWSESLGLIPLNYLGQGTLTVAQEVSDDGSVVLGSYNDPGGESGYFIWTHRHGFKDFSSFVANELRIDFGDWSVFQLGQLSPDGHKLTGSVERRLPGRGYEVSAFILDISPPCRPDFTDDGTLNFFDLGAFLAAFQSGDTGADIDGNGLFDVDDVTGYVGLFAAGCP